MANMRGRRLPGWVLSVLLVAVSWSGPAAAQTQIKPYMLIVFDTSGSMAWNAAGAATYGDGSRDPWGARWCCPGTGGSRLYACKNAMYRMVSATGDIQFALMTFPMAVRSGTSAANSFLSNQYGDNQVAGAWDYLRYRGPRFVADCPPAGAYVNNFLKVRFDDFGWENTNAILDWMDHQEYTAAWTPVENELRADGGTPLAWTLGQARNYLATVVAGDSYASCRPYKVILLTDGIPDCGAGETEATFWTAVSNLRSTGAIGKDVRTCVIGYNAASATLDGAATRGQCLGGETAAFTPVNEDELAVVLFRIVAGTVLTEICNNLDDDCDGLTDEGFTKYCNLRASPPITGRTLCVDPGEVCNGVDDNCDTRVDEGVQNACGGCGPVPTEVCNGIDDDCDTLTDEGLICGACTVEVCDGVDNDCDTQTDEGLGTRQCGSDVGECSYGSQSCVGGSWSACAGGVGPVAETCNNLDDNCDGLTDGITRNCGTNVGVCEFGQQICTAGAWGACSGGYNGTAEVCNLFDDDCDNLTDEGNPGGGASCGSSIGECRPGTVTCTAGVLVCTGGATPTAEVCDNRDNDCDGSTDEGNPGGGASCYTGPAGTSGRGICRPGVIQCNGGALVCTGQTLPAAEVCNGLDDDCDGLTDEGLGTPPCGSSVGECRPGVNRCVAGAWVCEGAIGPVAEVCDSRDNDCDGLTDEGNPGGGVPCGWNPGRPDLWDLGACDPGLTRCTGGALVCEGMVGPTAETCNGRDDDCDGAIDNSPALTISCTPPPPGICVAGTPACVGGVQVCRGEVPGTTETCNNVDDDCDGLTDEGLTRPCGTDEGECAAGTQTCVAGVWRACAGAIGPVAETCDNRDNDCDGITDGVTRPCGTDEGECTYGVETCWAGAWGTCIGGRGPRTEVCNALDDDCDGLTDEGNPGGGASCAGSVGECRPGTVRCVAGSLTCDGGVLPVAEICDNRDNDCDGLTDEGNPGGGASCYTGPPATRGVGVCENGITQCVAGTFRCAGETLPRAEDCNNLDDDCDTLTDEDLLPGACGTDEGECERGARVCVSGAWVCTGAVGPTPEVCDGRDNDCDAATDEGNPGGGVPCGWDPARPERWDLGECEPGIANCIAGAIVCESMIGPVPEECNGLDDDCNGLTDDGLALGEPCGEGRGDCEPGRLRCVGGSVQCVGGVGPAPETCDCADNDCDDMIDEDVVCPGASVCLDCSCALPCEPANEFSCPMEVCCECGLTDDPMACHCVRCSCGGVMCGACETCRRGGGVDECVPVACGECERCDPARSECVDICEGRTCPPGLSCLCGECTANCYVEGCPPGRRCENETCLPDPCHPVSCAPPHFCREGSCYEPCEPDDVCPTGEICFDGECVADPCHGVTCPPGVDCVGGECQGGPGTPCEGVDCTRPLVCRGGVCDEHECRFIECADGYHCERGTCVADTVPGEPGLDAGPGDGGGDAADGDAAGSGRTHVLATGTGGCICAAAGAGPPAGGPLALLGLVAIGAALRRDGRGRRRRKE
ncbi:MAG: MopE-related protein [Myxococcota bacterium]|nr:MopE-related protein [Myxococcota bacterium]